MFRWLRFCCLAFITVELALWGGGQGIKPARAASKTIPKIAFVFYDKKTKTHILSIADPNGKSVVDLFKDAYFFSPVWSPDGTQLAFDGGIKQSGTINWEVYLVGSDGTHLRKISAHTGNDEPGYVTWSPDGTQLIYGVRKYSDISFYRINADGSNEKKLSFTDVSMADSWITWSPDGKAIAVLTNNHSGPVYSQIYLADPDGENARPLPVSGASKPPANDFEYLAWAPDKQHIFVYSGLDKLESEIDVANVDGSNVKAILKSPRLTNSMSSLSVSPDSKQIVFVAIDPNFTLGTLALWVANADGSGLHVLTLGRELYYGGTSWGMIPQDALPKGGPISFPAAMS
jgi:Tol biopolymer transport system component